MPAAFSQYNPIFFFICLLLALSYLFLGISIISDIFMDGIGVITSQSVTI
jgi:hypothetical protein